MCGPQFEKLCISPLTKRGHSHIECRVSQHPSHVWVDVLLRKIFLADGRPPYLPSEVGPRRVAHVSTAGQHGVWVTWWVGDRYGHQGNVEHPPLKHPGQACHTAGTYMVNLALRVETSWYSKGLGFPALKQPSSLMGGILGPSSSSLPRSRQSRSRKLPAWCSTLS